MTTVQSQPLYLLVKRNPWEPKHEWESRLLFVEDNLDRHGLEKAIHLSLVWANVTFFGCSYPAHTQELVSDYPRPDIELLRSERKKRERVERKRRLSSGGGGEGGGGEEGARKQARGNSHGESSASETTHNTSGDDTDASFEQISLQVDALISAIRKQHEKKAEKEGTTQSRDDIPKEVHKMLQSMCMCSQCFSPGNSSSSLVNAITQRYIARFDKNFTHDFEFTETRNGASTECKIFFNGEFATSGRDENRKTAKQKASEQFVRLVNSYYKENGKPCCPYEPNSRRNK